MEIPSKSRKIDIDITKILGLKWQNSHLLLLPSPFPEIGIPKLVEIEHYNSNGIDFSFELFTRKTNQSKLRFISLMKLS